MNVINEKTQITLGNKTYNMKFDLKTIAEIQKDLKSQGLDYKFTSIFKGLEESDFSIILPLVCGCIRRCHPQVNKTYIEDLLDFSNLTEIVEAVTTLIDNAMPKEDKKKD